MKIDVEWTGGGYCLCCGSWIITIDGKVMAEPNENEDDEDDIKDIIPRGDMGTFGEYQTWHFEDWMAVWETYEDGKYYTEWILTNKEWIDKVLTYNEVPLEDFPYEDLFSEISGEDWRSNSCGGCI